MGYDNTNRGAMWSNVDRVSEKHPDFKGSLNIDGREYWLAGWKRKENANPAAPVIVFTVEAKQKHQEVNRGRDQEPTSPVDYGFNDDLPF